MTTGMSNSIFQLLQIKSNVTDNSSKCCVIVLDESQVTVILSDTVDSRVEMPKKQAQSCNETLVFTVYSLAVKWKKRFGFYYSRNAASSADLERLITVIVEKLLVINLHSLANICDQGSRNQLLYRSLGITLVKPYFGVSMHAICNSGESPITPYIIS